MKKLFETLRGNPLFHRIDADGFVSMLECMQAKTVRYERGEIILLAGSPVDSIGLVVSGCVHVLREDDDGKSHLIAELHISDLFAEAFVCAGVTASPVTVLAAENCEVLYLNYRKMLTTCGNTCGFHKQVIENMLALVAQKNLQLHQKIEILSKRTTRERVLLFLHFSSQGQKRFTIPFDREALAAYLCVDRSALSAELSRMAKEGLIGYSKNQFELL